jgi:hypothetical protein
MISLSMECLRERRAYEQKKGINDKEICALAGVQWVASGPSG